MKQSREGSLDLLKFFATCIIILHHFQQLTNSFFEGQLNFYNGNFYWGYMVELFFILSGYFSYRYSKTENYEEGFFSYWWKKYRRFLPLLIITGIAAAIVIYWTTVIKGTEFKYSAWDCLAGMFGVGRWFSTALVINNPTWYISVLLLCYAVFYFGTFLAKRAKINTNSVYLVFMIIGILMYHICSTYEFSMPLVSTAIARGLVCFFEGLLFRELLERFEPQKKAKWVALCVLWLAAFIVIYNKKIDFVADQLFYLLCFTVFPCVIILFKTSFMEKIGSAKIFATIGGISYNTYMWHLTVNHLLINVCMIKNITMQSNAVMVFCLLLSFVVGTLSYCLVGRKSGKRLATKANAS